MIKYFCDRCEKPLEPEDQNIFIRLDENKGIFVSVLAVTGDSKPVRDICTKCCIEIVCGGTPVTSIQPVNVHAPIEHQITPMPVPTPPVSTIATLQPPVAERSFDSVAPATTPPYEPSLPKEKE